MNALKKILTSKLFIALICLTALYTLAGFLLMPYLLRHYGPRVILEQTKKQAVIGKVRINPFLFTLEVNDFYVAETDGQRIIGLKQFFCDFELKSIIARAWTFSQIGLTGPLVNMIVSRDGSINLAQLIPPSEKKAPSTEDEKALPRLIVKEIKLKQGEVGLVDRRPSKPASLHYRPLQFDLYNLTTLVGQEGQITLTANGADGEKVRADGQLRLEPLLVRGTFAVDGLQLATLFPFVRDSVAMAPPQGKLALKAGYSFEASTNGGRTTLSGLDIALEGLTARLENSETPFFELASLKIGGGHLDLARHRIEVKSVTVSKGLTRLTVDESGRLNVGQITKASAETKPQPQAPSSARVGFTPWKIAVAGFNLQDLFVEYRDQSRSPEIRAAIAKIDANCKAEAEFLEDGLHGSVSEIGFQAAELKAELGDREQPLVQIDKIGLDSGKLDLASTGFTADKVGVQGGRINLVRQADGAINLLQLASAKHQATENEVAEKADKATPAPFLINTIDVSGLDVAVSDQSLKPKAAALTLHDIALTLANVDGKSPMQFDLALQVEEGGRLKSSGTINPTEPAVEAKVKVEDLNLVPAQPYLSQAVQISLKSGTISSSGSIRYGCKEAEEAKDCKTYKGGLEVNTLRMTGEGGDETLIGWNTLKTDKLNLDLRSNSLEVGDLKITGPTGKFVINKDRSLNLAKLIKTDQGTKKTPATKPEGESPFTYSVRRILVKSGKADFADFSLIYPFGTKIHNVNGVVTGISSNKGARTNIKLDGQVDDYGTAKVNGELDVSAPKSFTDVSLTFRNLEMAKLTPYSGTFAGRTIKSGKLSVDLQYKIKEGGLSGDNQFKVERLTLGDRIESPSAVNLPLDLAIALLEDSNGVIDLGLPVRGNLNSPEFSYGAIVGKAIASLITKIVASPFRMLGALLPDFGKDATLNAVSFEAGSSDLPPPEREKLVKLAEALTKRPQLTLTVTGVYSQTSDQPVLRTRHVSRSLAKVLGWEIRSDEDQDAFDFANSETEDGLEKLFKERFGGEAYKALKAKLKAEKKAEQEKAKVLADSGKAKPSAGPGEEEDQGRFSKLMFARLAEEEKIADAEFVQLADDRGQAVIHELTTVANLPRERVEKRPAKGLSAKAPIAVELNLEAARGN